MMHADTPHEYEEIRADLLSAMMRLFDRFPHRAHMTVKDCENDAFQAIIGVVQFRSENEKKRA